MYPRNTTEPTKKENMLNEIHRMALDDSHMSVPFSSDQLEMANQVIKNMQKKLLYIADLAQVGLGD